jgi:hypothetical protein
MGVALYGVLCWWRETYSGEQLLRAIAADDTNRAEWLIAMGARTDARDNRALWDWSSTPIRLAIEHKNKRIIRALGLSGSDLGAVYDPNQPSSSWNQDIDRTIARLQGLTDSDLYVELEKEERPSLQLLAEVIRRGGPDAIARLEKKLEALWKELDAELKAEPNVRRGMRVQLLVQSALQRLRGQDPPVVLSIKGPETQMVRFPEMPRLEVALINRDPEGRQVAWGEGGNYRHGREESWSFEVTDDKGRSISVVQPCMMMGGIMRQDELEPGKELTRRLWLGSYIEILPPGTYLVRAAYAFGYSIGTIQDKNTTFMLLSEPMRLVVEPPKDEGAK